MNTRDLANKVFDDKAFLAECAKRTRGETVLLSLHGSHLYGTANEGSDVDVRGVFLPSLEDCVLGRASEAVNFNYEMEGFAEPLDVGLWSVQKFASLLSHGDTNALSLFFARTHEGVCRYDDRMKFLLWLPVWDFAPVDLKGMRGYVYSQAVKYGAKGDRLRMLEELNGNLGFTASLQKEASTVTDASDTLKAMSEKYPKYIKYEDTAPDGKAAVRVLDKLFLHASPLSYMVDSCKAMEGGYGKRAEAAKEGNGHDWKALSHSLRVLMEMEELYADGCITYPLDSAGFLASVKRGEVSVEEVQSSMDFHMKCVESLEMEHKAKGRKPSAKTLQMAVLNFYGLTDRMDD